MNSHSLRGLVLVAMGVVIAAMILQTWLVLGWIVPMTVSGSSMAPTLLGPRRWYRCQDCRREFAVGLDQLPLSDSAVCPNCGHPRAMASPAPDQPGARLAVDRTAYAWREPRRWEVVAFHPPVNAGQLWIKRVVGLPGEAIALDDGDVLVNGRISRKSLANQRAVRQRIDSSDDTAASRTTVLDGVLFRTSDRWRPSDTGQLEYHHAGDGPITDESSYNQGATPPVNHVRDVMLTIEARLAGAGQLALFASTDVGHCELTADMSRLEIMLKLGDRSAQKRTLPATAADNDRFMEWTLSLFDRQAVVAIGDDIVLVEPWDRDRSIAASIGNRLTIGVRGLKGEIRRVAVWRDVYYAVRHSDGRQPGVEREAAVTWQLGPGEYFVLGDNAAISDDSRNWPSGPGVDSKLLIGKPLGVR